MGAARVRLLGPVDVVDDDGRPVTLGGPKERLVLAVLAVHAGEVVSEDRLVDALWGENPPRTAGKTLQSYVSRLRKALASYEGVAIESASPGYLLRCTPGARDVDRLEALLAEGRRAIGAGDPDGAAVLLSEAEQLWRGPVLGELAGEPFALGEAARLEELRTVVIEERIDAELAAGRHAAVVAELESLTARYPLRERLWKARMLALYRSGRQADALRAFQELRSHLAEELGIDPTPELAALEQAILVQSPELGSPTPQAAGRAEPETQPLPSGVVTFLLTDIEGSTALWERHAQDMDASLRAHDEAVGEAVAANGGVLLRARGEGDSTFSVFWRATDATAAAVAAQTAIADLDVAVPLRVRAAVHTGEAFERDGNYYGPAVNRAARLRDVAAGGETVVSRATAELVADHAGGEWELIELGERRLKDLARPEAVWALVPNGPHGDNARPSGDSAAATERPPLPSPLARYDLFVAREAERERLEELWQQALSGSKQAAFIAGEPGIGKTALAAMIARRAHEAGATVLFGRCDEGLGVPHQPFAEAVRVLIVGRQAELGRVAGAGELARLVPELASIAPWLPAPTTSDPETDRWRLFEAVTALFVAATQTAPVVLVLDDLHWAEKPTLFLLKHLLRAEVAMPLLVVGTYRDTELARTHPLADLLADLRRDSGAERVSLGGFVVKEVASLLEATAGHDLDERAVELAGALQRETGGNPFFCREVLRHLAESGAIFQADGRWTSHLAVEDLALPEGAREVIGRRLSRLSDASNDVLRVAAVVGPTFTLRLLEAVIEIADDELLDAVDAAVASGLVNEGDAGYEFTHALVRHTLLAELTVTRTTRLHRRIGEVIEAMPDADRQVEALARHFLDAATDGQEVKAASYALAAANQAIERAAFEEAAAWAERGIEALETHQQGADELLCDLWIARSTSDALAIGSEPGRNAARSAALRALSAGDGERLVAAAILMQEHTEGLGAVDAECELLLREALLARGHDQDRLRAVLLSRLAQYHAACASDRASALAESAEAVAIARSLEDAGVLIEALTARCFALESYAGDHEGFAIAEELAALESRSTFNEFRRLSLVGGFRFELGDRDGFEACVAEMASFPPMVREGLPSMYHLYWTAMSCLLDGKWSDFDELTTAPLTGHAVSLAAWAGQTYLGARERGCAGDLVSILQAGLAVNPNVPVFEAALCLHAAEGGDHDPARLLLRQWMRTGSDALPDDVARGIGLGLYAEAAVRLGDLDASALLQSHLNGFAGRILAIRAQITVGAADRYRAMLASLLGRFDEAETLFESALSIEECGLRSPVLATRTRLWYGRMLADKGDHDRARAMLRRALADAEDLGMAGVAAEARELLVASESARAADPPPPVPA